MSPTLVFLLSRDPATMSRERTGFSNSQSSLATPIAISRGKRGFSSVIELARGVVQHEGPKSRIPADVVAEAIGEEAKIALGV